MMPETHLRLYLLSFLFLSIVSALSETSLECKEVHSSSGEDAVVECTMILPKSDLNEQISSCLDNEKEEFCVRVNLDARYKRKVIASSENEKQSSSSSTSESTPPVRVGAYTYREPFHENYPHEVVRVLRRRLKNFDSLDVQEQINWYSDLGMAHRQVLEQTVVDADAIQETLRALEAFQEARLLVLRLQDKIQLAAIYVSIGETYSLSPDSAHYAEYKPFLERAEALYRELLTSESRGMENLMELTINWADTCIRLGVALLDGDNMAALDDVMQLDDDLLSDSMKQIQDAAGRAESLFENAIDLLSNIRNDANAIEKQQIQRHLANAKQNLATARTMKGDLTSSIELLNEAFSLYSSMLPQTRLEERGTSSLDMADIRAAMGEVLLSLSDAYLQLGRYDSAKEKFQRMASWYEEFNLAPPPEPKVGDLTPVQEMITTQESMLEQYLDVVNGLTEEGYFDEISGEYFYEKNDGYEGDLHSILGGLYMAMGDDVAASSHLSQAIQLFEMNGETQARNTADAKFNLAMLYFRMADFKESARLYSEAVDIYRIVVGEGVNPFLEDAMASSIMFDTGKLGNAKKPTESQKKPTSIHQELIDLEEYRQSLLNETLSGDEL